MTSIASYNTNKARKKAFILIITLVLPAIQIANGIVPLQSAEAQDPVIGPPSASNPASSPAEGVSNVSSSTILVGSNTTNATSTDEGFPGTTLSNDTLSDGTILNDTLANGTFADGVLSGGLGDETFPNASIASPGDITGADQFGSEGAGGFGGEDQLGTEGIGGDDQFGAGGGLNETFSEEPPIPQITTIISNNTGDSTNPNVAVSGSNMYVAWEDTTGGNREILLTSSLDGQNFTSVRNVTQTAGESLDPRLAVFGSNMYLVWEDTTSTGGSQIMFVKSADSGATFTTAKNLSNNTGDSANPNLAVSGNNVYVVWEQIDTNSTSDASKSEVTFVKSADSGATFTTAKNLSNNTGDSANPNLAVSGNNVYVVWEDDSAGGNEIILDRSANNGVNFDPPRNISNSPGESLDPRIAVSESNVYVIWVDYSLGNSTESEIMLIRSTNSGANFASAENLSNTPGESADPRIAVSEGNVYIAWEDATSESGNGEIKFVRSSDNGATFTSARNLSNNNGLSFDPRLTVSGSNVYVVWEDTTSGSGGSSDIFLARSTNNGAAFGSVQNLSNSPVESFDPYIATSRSKLFVLWSDDKGGNAEVIFTDKTRNIATPEGSNASSFEGFGTEGFGTEGFGDIETDPFGTEGLGLAPTDPSLSGGTGGLGLAPTDPSLSGGTGGLGLAPTDPSLSGGTGGLGLAPTDPSLQMGTGVPPL